MKRTLEHQKKKKVGWDKQCSLFLFFLFIVVVVVVVDGVVLRIRLFERPVKYLPYVHYYYSSFIFWIILKFPVQLQNSYSVSEHTAFGSGKQMRFRNAWPTGRVFASCWMDDASSSGELSSSIEFTVMFADHNDTRIFGLCFVVVVVILLLSFSRVNAKVHISKN